MSAKENRDALVREIRREAGRVRDDENEPPGTEYSVSADDLDDWADRLAALPVGEACPYVRSGDEGTHYCTLSGPPAVPAGFVLVPVEPTQSMLDANGDCPGYPEGKAWLERDARETWKAMLAARPDAPAGEKA